MRMRKGQRTRHARARLLGACAAAGLVLALSAEALAGGRHHSHRHYRSSPRSSVSFSFGYSSGYRYYGSPRWGYGYSYAAPVYVRRPVYIDGCAPYPYYGRLGPSTSVTYVYVDPPTSVRTVTSDSAYHEWQGALGTAPRYETVPRVVVVDGDEPEDEPAPERDYREVAPGTGRAEQPGERPGVEVVNPWEMLARGDYASARDAFGAVAEARRHEARPKIGYAIASAALGDEAAAAAALRTALIVEPEDFRLPVRSEDLMPVLERVSHTLGNLKDRDATSHSRWLVIAACEYLRGDFPKAREAIKRSREYGETHLGAKNLWRLLGLSDKPLEKVKISD